MALFVIDAEILCGRYRALLMVNIGFFCGRYRALFMANIGFFCGRYKALQSVTEGSFKVSILQYAAEATQGLGFRVECLGLRI